MGRVYAWRVAPWGLGLGDGRACRPADAGPRHSRLPPLRRYRRSPPRADDNAAIGDIVVTALKRETVLQRTPDAITALSGDALASQGRRPAGRPDDGGSQPVVQQQLRDLADLHPRHRQQLLHAGRRPGRRLLQRRRLRLGSGGNRRRAVRRQRVEVLRGPQGALYGRNATGGAINVISAPPTSTFQGQVGAVVGDYGRVEGSGFLSGPLGLRLHRRKAVRPDEAQLWLHPQRARGAARRARRASTTSSPSRCALQTSTGYRRRQPASDRLLPARAGQRPGGEGPARPLRRSPPNCCSASGPVPTSARSRATSAATTARSMAGSPRSRRRLDRPSSRCSAATATASTSCPTTRTGRRRTSPRPGWSRPAATQRRCPAGVDRQRRFDWLVGATYVNFRQDRVTYVFDAIPLGFVVPGAPLNMPFPGQLQRRRRGPLDVAGWLCRRALLDHRQAEAIGRHPLHQRQEVGGRVRQLPGHPERDAVRPLVAREREGRSRLPGERRTCCSTQARPAASSRGRSTSARSPTRSARRPSTTSRSA